MQSVIKNHYPYLIRYNTDKEQDIFAYIMLPDNNEFGNSNIWHFNTARWKHIANQHNLSFRRITRTQGPLHDPKSGFKYVGEDNFNEHIFGLEIYSYMCISNYIPHKSTYKVPVYHCDNLTQFNINILKFLEVLYEISKSST